MTSIARQTECLVIGSGIAGLTTALTLAEKGVETTVITAAPEITESNTWHAQGGIIFQGMSRNQNLLMDDILEAGHGINYLPAVRQLAELGALYVQEVLIEKAGVSFDRDPDTENFQLALEGGHREPRILHTGDESGKSIQAALYQYCQQFPNLHFLPSTSAVNLLMTSHHSLNSDRRHELGRCFGAFAFDQKSGEVYPITAPHTVLATGGVGQLFLHNTNSRYARGDGLALADRAGCRLENLEYVQFHPTTFYKDRAPRFLVSEALRGKGAILRDASGERFLSKYLPDYAIPELAPRDRVSQAIQKHLLSLGGGCVYLDITHESAEWIAHHFPFVSRTCRRYGVDPAKEPIPVVPGAHYLCGGVWTDLEGRTTTPGLWAVGEVACTGLHGANRLASTSLLEGLVWGRQAGMAVTQTLRTESEFRVPDFAPWQSGTIWGDPSFLMQDWLTLKHTMWNYVGLTKTDDRLRRAEGILTELARGINFFYRKAHLSDELIGLRHAVHVALRILGACQANSKSLGCYVRESQRTETREFL